MVESTSNWLGFFVLSMASRNIYIYRCGTSGVRNLFWMQYVSPSFLESTGTDWQCSKIAEQAADKVLHVYWSYNKNHSGGYVRNWQKCWWRSLYVSALYSWKWLQTMESDMVNYQKRYLAISWTTISSFMFGSIVKLFLFCPRSRQSQSDIRRDTLAIPFWYINACKSILSPHGFPLVEFQMWTSKKRSREVRHTWPALSKNP